MQYDTAFRRQAAISKNLHCVNPTLYSILLCRTHQVPGSLHYLPQHQAVYQSQQLKTSPQVTHTTARLLYNGHNRNHHSQYFVKWLQQWRYACCTIAVKVQGAHLLTASMRTFASIAEEHTQLKSAQGDTSLDQDRVQRRAASVQGWRTAELSELVYCHHRR